MELGADSRPDLKPQVITTAANLAVYDESWRVLREEYLEVGNPQLYLLTPDHTTM